MRSNAEYEAHVSHFLTENKATMLIYQFELLKDGHGGRTLYSPDFVAVNGPNRKVYAVEVSVCGSTKQLEKRLRNSGSHIAALKAHLLSTRLTDGSYADIEQLVFVKATRVSSLRKALPDIHVWPVEVTLCHWLWSRKVREPTFDVGRSCPEECINEQESRLLQWNWGALE